MYNKKMNNYKKILEQEMSFLLFCRKILPDKELADLRYTILEKGIDYVEKEFWKKVKKMKL